jgi:hypothetical protein
MIELCASEASKSGRICTVTEEACLRNQSICVRSSKPIVSEIK